ncbi:triple tyrosine motif-containing protein [Flavobacterium sp.]|uniref:helix-turn-helix and ligand-binding sensor domain-containing protein n=1 Tax=Flavobacterium sp. TaxID=239 RepID=UPI0024885BEA|nr:triple tyrosine motif-containing protein [Flavobacterium sp.]MDI1317853.1 triple tyrosine motif-containing protein [Flavobacterium sp.]
MNLRSYLLIILYLTSLLCYSQELPPVVNYQSSVYGAGNQNWMISQDSNQFLFFANNEGLLEFNGSAWTLYPSPNETIIRSVNCIENKIYTGSYMDFGYWERQKDGQLVYHSLCKTLPVKLLYDEEFWNILPFDNWILFQSLQRIYAYNIKTKSFSVIQPKEFILRAFKTSKGIFYQTNEGLFEIEGGKSKVFLNNDIVKENRIVNIIESVDGLLLITQNNGIYLYQNNSFSKFSTAVDSQIQQSSIYSGQKLYDNSLVLGTISNGIFILDQFGKEKFHITQKNRLGNNTILSLFEDIDKNLWLGLDNGINCINLQSPIRSYVDDSGILGTIYASKVFNEKLYIGTNQGLFYKNVASNSDFSFIPGTKGQVWSLFVYDNTLFCGHDSGTFIVSDTSANLIFKQSGTWKFEVYANKIFQGNYYGISILEKQNGRWSFKHKIKNFNYSSKYFEIIDGKEIYVGHEYNGIFRLNVSSDFSAVTSIFKYKDPKKSKNASLVKYNNQLYYASKEGVFKLNSKDKKFYKDRFLSQIFDKQEYVTGKMIVDSSNILWFFTKNYIHYYSKGKLSTELKRNSLPIPASLTNSMPGYENISQTNNNTYLLGTTDGYYLLKNNFIKFNKYKVSLTSISSNVLNKKLKNTSIIDEGKFNYNDNNITISYTIPDYDIYLNSEYQYKLEGLNDIWSEWTSKTTVNFENLPAGDYVFKVRAKVANSLTDNIASYSFVIKKPWYANNFAVLIYFVLFGFLIYYINKFYTEYHNKRHQKIIVENNLLLELKELEIQKEIMNIKNEQLSIDVDKKSKELAVSTINLIEKTELLNIIKEDLKNSEDSNSSGSIKSIISTINKSVKEEDTWNKFKDAFDSADKDFFKKIKLAHPALTPNDLRMCAYLRLNLSSKEIAPLLNISVRSVEIKRYRLRKKMDLQHEQGLVEYILNI